MDSLARENLIACCDHCARREGFTENFGFKAAPFDKFYSELRRTAQGAPLRAALQNLYTPSELLRSTILMVGIPTVVATLGSLNRKACSKQNIG